MKVLVTGGAGFLGSKLCEKLIENNDEVFCIDNLYTGSIDNLSKIISNKNFHFIEHNIIEYLDIETYIGNDEKIDMIYNLACPASPKNYQKDPIMTLKTCFIGAMNMLELAKKYNAKILQTSTSEIYGAPLEHPQKETYRGNVNPIGIRACYDEGKRVVETLFFDYHRMYGVDIKVVRIFNAYGTTMDVNDGRVIINFVAQALRGEDITIYGSGKQTRCFCYADDIIDGLIRMMKTENFTGPVNIGNPVEKSILEIADMIIKMTNSSSKLVYKPFPEDDLMKRKPDISLAKEKLGWQPKVSLEEGLKKVIECYKDKIDCTREKYV